MKLLKSMEELLYEVMLWLVFYPRTLWLALRHPLRMMDYSDGELTQRSDDQYTDTVSPPLFLILSIIIGHLIELATRGQSELVLRSDGLDRLITDDTTLLTLRAISYALFPLAATVVFLRLRRIPLDREAMRAPFYSQCYLTAPYALVFGALTLADTRVPWVVATIAAAMVGAILVYLSIQTAWFAQHAGISRWRALGAALGSYAISLTLLLGIAIAF